MDLSVSVPHPHATLLLSPSASMLLPVIDIVIVEMVDFCRCAVVVLNNVVMMSIQESVLLVHLTSAGCVVSGPQR